MNVEAVTDAGNPSITADLDMGSSADSFCFLVQVITFPNAATTDAAAITSGCDIDERETPPSSGLFNWWLSAAAARIGTTEVTTRCTARCVDF
jgi:hypothetical protein